MERENTIQMIKTHKIIVVVRGIYGTQLLKLADALSKGGIRAFEITYDPALPNALEVMGEAMASVGTAHPELCLGCGTVLSAEQVTHAKEVGAKFIVSPNFDATVVKTTLENGLVSIPGCMTPSEIVAADLAGADFIKLFPAGTLGLKYCKDILAPLHHVKYLATVGITEQTFREYLEIGFSGAGVSSQLIDQACRKAENWEELTRRAERFVAIAREFTQ